MGKIVDLSGKFGRLTFMFKSPLNPRMATYKCECGIEKEYFTSNVRSGKSLSCGCLHRQSVSERSTKHGNAKRGQHTRAYMAWANMLNRCTKPYRNDFERYGGRGISVCDRWQIFDNFLSDMGEPPDGLSLDRKNNNGNYEPENCKWSTPKEQANNRRPRSKNKLRTSSPSCVPTNSSESLP